jgi:hypothetical protein
MFRRIVDDGQPQPGAASPAEADGETWIIMERLFSGFPDPPAYAVFFLSAEGRVIAATDMELLPGRWRAPR